MSWDELHVPIMTASRLHWARRVDVVAGRRSPAICSKYSRGYAVAFESAPWCKHCTRMAENGRQS